MTHEQAVEDTLAEIRAWLEEEPDGVTADELAVHLHRDADTVSEALDLGFERGELVPATDGRYCLPEQVDDTPQDDDDDAA